MVIRKATQDDKVKISETHTLAIKKLCAESYSHDKIKAWTSVLVPSAYESAINDKHVVVADDDGFIAGLGILDLGSAEIHAVYVHPDYSGQGVGSLILEALEETARQNRLKLLTLYSTINAVQFYRHHCYQGDALKGHDLPNGARLECTEMRKCL